MVICLTFYFLHSGQSPAAHRLSNHLPLLDHAPHLRDAEARRRRPRPSRVRHSSLPLLHQVEVETDLAAANLS